MDKTTTLKKRRHKQIGPLLFTKLTVCLPFEYQYPIKESITDEQMARHLRATVLALIITNFDITFKQCRSLSTSVDHDLPVLSFFFPALHINKAKLKEFSLLINNKMSRFIESSTAKIHLDYSFLTADECIADKSFYRLPKENIDRLVELVLIREYAKK